jgi:uncharacterized protein (DUF1501 family)
VTGFRTHPTRRAILRSAVAASALFPAIVRELRAADDPAAPLLPHRPAKAKRVIFLFMSGGVSHVDTFDPKPRLAVDHGKSVKLDHPETKNRPGYEKLFLKRPGWEFRKHGSSGTEVSDLFLHVGACADDLCVIRSLHTGHSNHYNATLGMHTGSFTVARPSLGSWVSYGLGTLNRNLPSFVAIAPFTPYAGGQLWSADFLPGAHQGTHVVPSAEPMRNVRPRVPAPEQRRELDALAELNRLHAETRANDPALSARMQSFETAFGMQAAAPEAFDLTHEADATLALYNVQRGQTTGFGWQCLVARRLAERGVRFVELIDTGASNNWDSHGDMADHARLARNVDKPIAGLLTDLKRRGMLDDTLVVWTTEFGRTPFNNTAENKGREHHNWGFSSWLAGAGVKAGTVYGATDEHGIRAVEKPADVNDFHATILHLLGMDHEKLTYRHAGRDFRLTDVAGRVLEGVLA